MNLHVDIQSASTEPVPEEDDIRRWIGTTLSDLGRTEDSEICVRLVDTAEMASLNQSYRGKQGPTNVLSFPSELPAGLELPLLGDIVICAQVVREEASHQHKALEAHWAHMTVHGTLHLLGYDHQEDAQAEVMEGLETRILQQLDYPCPYQGEQHMEHQGA